MGFLSSSLSSSSAASPEAALTGLRFGMASAVISAVVLVLSLRPLARFRIALVVSLLTIALVDSMADAYALFNAEGDYGSAGMSIAAKVAVCGSLAAVAYLGGRGATATRRTQGLLYVMAAAFVAGQLLLTVLTSDSGDRGKEAATLAGLFVAAVALSVLLNKAVTSLENHHRVRS